MTARSKSPSQAANVACSQHATPLIGLLHRRHEPVDRTARGWLLRCLCSLAVLVCCLTWLSHAQTIAADDMEETGEIDGIKYIKRPGDRFELKIASQFPRENMTTVEALPVEISLKNVSEKSRAMFSDRWDLALIVLGPDGEPVPRTRFGEQLGKPMPSSGKGYFLHPDDLRRSRCYLNAAHDLSLPGKYQAWVEWTYLAGVQPPNGPALIETYKSNVIEFQLHPPRRSVDHPPTPGNIE